jgi:hypothetical protein
MSPLKRCRNSEILEPMRSPLSTSSSRKQCLMNGRFMDREKSHCPIAPADSRNLNTRSHFRNHSVLVDLGCFDSRGLKSLGADGLQTSESRRAARPSSSTQGDFATRGASARTLPCILNEGKVVRITPSKKIRTVNPGKKRRQYRRRSPACI